MSQRHFSHINSVTRTIQTHPRAEKILEDWLFQKPIWLWEFSLPFIFPQTFWITCIVTNQKSKRNSREQVSFSMIEIFHLTQWDRKKSSNKSTDTYVHRVINCQILILKIWEKTYFPNTFRRIPVALLRLKYVMHQHIT